MKEKRKTIPQVLTEVRLRFKIMAKKGEWKVMMSDTSFRMMGSGYFLNPLTKCKRCRQGLEEYKTC